MALDEQTRHALHQRFDEVLGPEHAVAAMSAYPASPLDVVATKADIGDVRHAIEVLRSDMRATLHEEINRAMTSQTRTVLFGLIGTVLATGGTILGAAALLR